MEVRFLNHEVWNLGLSLFELLDDSWVAAELEPRPAMNLYATLLADTISVFACLS